MTTTSGRVLIMNKEEVAAALREMADLLEITEANQFEYMAMRNGAQGLEEWSGDLNQATEENSLTEIPSVGKGIAKIITDLVRDGRSDELDRVRGLVPPELPKLLRFRGLGPKRVRTLWKELEIESPDDLKLAADEGRVQKLKGFGAKTGEKILSSIEYFANLPEQPAVRTDLSDDVIRQAPKSTGQIFAGTSGYSYPAWIGNFYASDAKTDDLLAHYSNQLPTVEINNTFYRFPAKSVVAAWVEQTPDHFRFALKSPRRVTHQLRLNQASKKHITEFVQRASELGERLGCLLYQLPADFSRDDQRLETLLTTLPAGPRYAIEFRHESWFDESVFGKLRDHNISCVCGDAEDLDPFQVCTADFVYARLRRTEYSAMELDQWNSWFDQQRAENRDVFVFLKHDDTGAIPNAVVERWTKD